MIVEQGNSLLETRRRNRILIKNKIFRKEYALRSEIAKELGLTLPTITTSVNEMIAEGLLEEGPVPDRLLTKGTGRRPTSVSFRGDAGYAIGIELGPYNTRAVLINLKGETVECLTDSVASESYEKMIMQVINLVSHFKRRIEGKRLIGIGIGIPGFVDTHTGEIRRCMRKDWNGKNISEDLSPKVGAPVRAGNNARFRARGYEMLMKENKPEIFAYLFVSRGIACPLIIQDFVLSGNSAGAGELGQTTIWRSDATQEGRLYTMDELASEHAIFAECAKKMEEGSLPELKNRLYGEAINMRTVLDLQMQGNAVIDAIMDRAIMFQGVALANTVNLLNPSVVVVDAYMMSYEKNRERLLKYSREHFFGLNESEVEIVFRPYDSYNGALGDALETIQLEFLNL